MEYALTLLVTLLVLLGLFDLGRGFYIQNVLMFSAQRGARYALASPDDTPGIVAAVQASLFGLDPALASVTITQDEDDGWIEVEVSYPFSAITPLIAPFIGENGTVTLRDKARMYL